MNDAAQIRRCSGTLRAKPLLLQTPDLKISNREPLRLEINVTQTKQTTQPHSNREAEALFSNRVRAVNRLCDCSGINSAQRTIGQPARRHSLKISNRELPGIRIDLTHTNQTLHRRSNRENHAWPLDRVRADGSARRNIDQHAKVNPPEPAIRKTRRNLITQFNKQSRKRGLKAPSK
jgi:hypothetical protein